MIKKYRNRIVWALGILFVFVFFWRITTLTPLAGDDWGYALNGMRGNPFVTLFDFYFSWSGRLLSEFWGLVVACRKSLWNILNPLLFAAVFGCILKLGADHKKVSAVGILLFLFFTVSEYLRMETYTWIMGTTYVIPLLLALIYFMVAEDSIRTNTVMKGWQIILTSVLCFLIGVAMENIAAIMLVAIVLMLLYCFFKNHKIRKDLIINFVLSVSGLLVMRLSPGSTFRTMRDHAAWAELPLLDKIGNQLGNFFSFTFIENKYLIFTLGMVLLALLFFKGMSWIRKHAAQSAVVFISQAIGVFFACANVLAVRIPALAVLLDPNSTLVRVWWILYVILTFAALWWLIEDEFVRAKAIFFLMVGGACNMVMLYSPIFGSRSSLYFVFFTFVVIELIYSQIDNDMKWLDWLVLVLLSGFVLKRANGWLIKYNQVAAVQQVRLAEIEYYQGHPDEDAWIIRMPPFSVHGGDIEEDDIYHQETFREYYGLDENQKLIFYWADSYE